MCEPVDQRGIGGKIARPFVERQHFLAAPAWPESVDQHAVTIVRRRLGGRWDVTSEDATEWRVFLPTGINFSPAGFVAAAIMQADLDDLDSEFDAQVLLLQGKVGIPLGPVRPYGQVGGTYHQAKFHTNQTMTQQPSPNTLSYELRTRGWSWTFGGGVEIWFSSIFGIYGEFNSSGVKGVAEDDAEGLVDDRMMSVLVGARVRLGG